MPLKFKRFFYKMSCSLWLCWGYGYSSEVRAVTVPRLSVIGVAVNGSEPKEIPQGSVLELIRGDQLRLLYATLQKSSRSPDLINFVGFWQKNLARKGDDRDLSIDTKLLKKEWSRDKKGREYRIEALTAGTSHGDIRIHIIEPTLHSVAIEVNDQLRTVLAGQTLELKPSDQIKVKEIRTNHPRLNQEAQVRFKEEKKLAGIRQVELELSYQNLPFGRVSLLVKP